MALIGQSVADEVNSCCELAALQDLNDGPMSPRSSSAASVSFAPDQQPSIGGVDGRLAGLARSAIALTYSYADQSEAPGRAAAEASVLQSLPPTVETNLAINQAYQEICDSFLLRVEYALARVREKQKAIGDALTEHESTSTNKKFAKVPALTYMPPYFKDSAGMVPPRNVDQNRKLGAGEYDALVQPQRKWTKADREALRSHVADSHLQAKLMPLNSRRELLAEKMAVADGDDAAALGAQMQQLERQIARTKSLSTDHLLDEVAEDCSSVDWLLIASTGFKATRTALDCELYWRNQMSPKWNQNEKWSQQEMLKLRGLVEQKNLTDWSQISQKLGTNRTAFQCFEKYQSEMNAALLKTNWTESEDDQLKDVVSAVRNGSHIPWEQVAYFMEGRTRAQVMCRWRRHVDPQVRRGRWIEEEDLVRRRVSQLACATAALQLLMVAVHKLGARDWGSVAEMIPGRTDSQCRERWCNALNAGNKVGNWTPEEDDTLKCLCQMLGRGEWSKVSKFLPGRTPSMVKMRYRTVMRLNNKPAGSPPKKLRRTRLSAGAGGDEEAADGEWKGKERRAQSGRSSSNTTAEANYARVVKLEARKERVRDLFAQMAGAPPVSTTTAADDDNGDRFLDALPAELCTIIRAKLNAIRLRNAVGADGEPALGSASTSPTRRKSSRLVERLDIAAEPEAMLVERQRLDVELAAVVHELDARREAVVVRQCRRQSIIATATLFEASLTFDGARRATLPVLPPSVASMRLLRDLRRQRGMLDATAAECDVEPADTTPQFHSLPPAYTAQVLGCPRFQQLQEQFKSILLWPTIVSAVPKPSTTEASLTDA